VERTALEEPIQQLSAPVFVIVIEALPLAFERIRVAVAATVTCPVAKPCLMAVVTSVAANTDRVQQKTSVIRTITIRNDFFMDYTLLLFFRNVA
jgi:hypothetical protein